MDIRKIKKLIELLEESNLSEMEIKEGEESIRLSRVSSMAAPVSPAATTISVGETSPAPPQAPDGEDLLPVGHPIKSPMVGTFYGAPKPGSEPFVEVGSTVEVGDTLCVIEAMKIFNQIETDAAGTVVAVLKDNGSPVEYGEVLFVID
jgi:acetyl-CoA carboxylase biotin carboxyl carrier protein